MSTRRALRFVCLATLFARLALAGSPLTAATPYTPSHPDPLLERWRWTTYPELEGLGLECMVEGPDGAMWFGVMDGVRRYDGLEWTAYTTDDGILGAPVRRLCVGRDGRIYAGTHEGISMLSRGRWQRVFPEAGQMPWYVYDLFEAADGSLWAGTDWGALWFGPADTLLITTEETAAAVPRLAPNLRAVALPDTCFPGRPWRSGPGLAVRSAGWMASGIVLSVMPGGPAERAGLRLGDQVSTTEGATGYLTGWLAGPPASVIEVAVRPTDGGEQRLVGLERVRGQGVRRECGVYDVYQDRDGAIWLGFASEEWEGGEVARCDAERVIGGDARGWRLFTDADGMQTGAMPNTIQTRDGTVWVVSANGYKGINRFAEGRWAVHSLVTEGAMFDHHNALLEASDGALYVGDAQGIDLYRKGSWRTYRRGRDGLPLSGFRIVDIVEASDGALWMAGKGGGVARVDLGSSKWSTYDGLFACAAEPGGSLWFVSQDSGVVHYQPASRAKAGTETWTRYGPEDGLMFLPASVEVTRAGEVLAGGNHGGTAAVARLDEGRWGLTTFPAFGPIALDGQETAGGAVYFRGINVTKEGWVGGLLEYGGEGWRHHAPPAAPPLATTPVRQSDDGALWVGSWHGLLRREADGWRPLHAPPEVTGRITALCAGVGGALYVGTRDFGVLRLSGSRCERFGVKDGLPGNRIRALGTAADGSVIVSTDDGFARYDGGRWVPTPFGPELAQHLASILAGPDGSVWFSYYRQVKESWEIWTVRYSPGTAAPETRIPAALSEVSQPGNLALSWEGHSPWHRTPDDALQFSWRLDEGTWAPFSPSTYRVLQALPAGRHLFQVKARDLDLREDPTPASVAFRVLPPVWMDPRFLAVALVLLGAVGYQSIRVVNRDRRLRSSNTSLAEANASLRREMADRVRTEAERNVLGSQLKELKYLDRLRSAIATVRAPQGVAGRAVEVLHGSVDGLGATAVRVCLDQQEHSRGVEGAAAHRYERTIEIAGKPRGRLMLSCDAVLSESQERALLDETVQQIAAAVSAREMEMQIAQSSRLASLGEMAAGVAHELNQPLTVVSTTAGDISYRLASGEEISPQDLQEMMQDVQEVVGRMDETIDHLRIFSREPSAEIPSAFCINEVVGAALRFVQAQLESHGIRLQTDLCPDLPDVYGSAHAIEQVVLNLLANARDALDERKETAQPGEGRSDAQEKRLYVRTCVSADRKRVVLEVEDTGVGIRSADIDRIYEPFFTTKAEDRGTGLGLSISYGIVRDHGGGLNCESSEGIGSMFRMSLPASTEEG